MQSLPGLWSLTPIGALIGVIVLMYWLLATGRLITKASHERELQMAGKRGDEWKETAIDTRAVNRELLTQNGSLVQGARTLDGFVRANTPGSIADTGGGLNVGA